MQTTRRKALLVFLGLSSGFVAAAGLALALHFVIQPKMQKETWGREHFQFESFDLWHDANSPLIESRNETNQQLTSALDDLLVTLEIQRDEIPEKIDVFVHDNISQLMRSVGLRKGVDTMNSKASLDLLAGESPRICLSELLVCHGWGKCMSQVAYRGLITYLAYPGRNFHAISSALPETMQISLEDIISLETAGFYPETFYQKFTSPFSKRYILTLDALADFSSIPDRIGESEIQDLSSLLAASLIQYIIEDVSSLQALKENWTRTSTAKLLEITSAGSLDEISRAWYEQAAIRGDDGDVTLWKARFAAQSGDYMLAHSLAAGWKADNLTKDRRELSLLCSLLFGDFNMTEQLLSSSGDEMISQDLSSWASTVMAMTHVVSERIFLSADLPLAEAQQLCSQLESTISRIQTSLGIQMDELPLPLRVFIYEDSTTRDRGRLLTQPDLSPNPSLHLVLDDNAEEALSLSLFALWPGEKLDLLFFRRECYGSSSRRSKPSRLLLVPYSRKEIGIHGFGCVSTPQRIQ